MRDDELKNLGVNIERLRKARSLSQAELAHYVESSQKTIHEIENVKTRPGWDLLEKLAGYFDMQVRSLLEPLARELKTDGLEPGLAELLANQGSLLPPSEPRITDVEVEILRRLPSGLPREAYRMILCTMRDVARACLKEPVIIRLEPSKSDDSSE